MNSKTSTFNSPFKRPWMNESGAAAAAAGNTGVKGIIAGNFFAKYSTKKLKQS